MTFFKHKYLILFFFAFYISKGYSQKFILKDVNYLTPIPNVSIFNSDKSISTISDFNGQFDLSPFTNSDTVYFTHISYKKLGISISVLQNFSFGSEIFLEPKEQALSEVILSVGRNVEKIEKVSKKVSVITKQSIALDMPPTSADLLYYGGGVRIQKTQGGGGSPVIRGFEANRVLLVIDGVRMNNAIYRSGHLQNVLSVDPQTLERTEVIFGPSSVAYGSDALGGVVHFYTKTPSFNNETQTVINGFQSFNPSFNHSISSLNVEVSKSKWASFTNFSYSTFGDIIMGKKRNHGFKEWGLNKHYLDFDTLNNSNLDNPNPNLQKNTGYSQLDFLQKFNFKIDEKQNVIFNIQHSKSSDIYRYDKLNEYSSDQNLKYANWKYGPQKRTMFSTSYNFISNKSFFDRGNLILSFQDINESRHNRRFQSLQVNNQLENVKVYSVNSDFFKQLSENSSLSYGYEFTHNKVKSRAFGVSLKRKDESLSNFKDLVYIEIPTRYPSGGSNYSTSAAYFDYRKGLSRKSNINFGLRYTYTWLNARWNEEALIDANLNYIKSNNESFTGSVGYVYRFEKNWQISSSFSSGFRSPNIDDIGKIRENKGVLSVPNQSLKPEYAYNSELSLSKFSEDKNNMFSINFYYTHINNHILRDNYNISNDLSTIDPTTILYNSEEVKTMANVNFGNAYIYGGALDIKSLIFENIFFKANLTSTKGRSISNDYNLPSISPLFGQFSLKYAGTDLKIQLSYRFSSSKNPLDYSDGGEDSIEETPFVGLDEKGNKVFYGMPSWGVLKFSSSFQISNKTKASLVLDNLLDIHYREFASGISSPGRNLNIVLEHNF